MEHESGRSPLGLYVKALLFTLVVPGTGAFVIPFWIALHQNANTGWPLAVGGSLLVAGALVYLRCAWDFVKHGRGTPSPTAAPKRLVERGLYRWVRNPMYVGVLSAILGWVVVYPSTRLALYWLAVFALLSVFVALHEEPHLRREFGEEYDAFRERVPRWLPLRPQVSKWLGMALATVFLAIQLVPVDRSNPAVEGEVAAAPEVLEVLRRACFDCHSNRTVWPWYSYVAPVSWQVARDVREAREHVNFSTWNRLSPGTRLDVRRECWEKVSRGEMPLAIYLPEHPEARLSDRDRSLLRQWAQAAEDPNEPSRQGSGSGEPGGL